MDTKFVSEQIPQLREKFVIWFVLMNPNHGVYCTHSIYYTFVLFFGRFCRDINEEKKKNHLWKIRIPT